MRLSTLKKQLSEYPSLPRTWTGTQTFKGTVRFTESEWSETNPRCLVIESAEGENGVPMIQFRGKAGQTAGYIEFASEYNDDEQTGGDSVRGNSIAHSGSGTGGGKFQINMWDRSATSSTTKAVITARVNAAGEVLFALYGATPVPRAAAITKPTGGGTVDTEARAALNAVIDALADVGVTF